MAAGGAGAGVGREPIDRVPSSRIVTQIKAGGAVS